MKIGQKYFSVMKASLIYLEMMEKNNVKRCIGERLSAKCTKKTVKFGGGSVMVFGMFSSQSTTPLVRLQTRVNPQIYKNIVQDHVVPIIQNSGLPLCKMCTGTLAQRLECSPMARETWVQSQVESYQRL